jgi:hypothetical protein
MFKMNFLLYSTFKLVYNLKQFFSGNFLPYSLLEMFFLFLLYFFVFFGLFRNRCVCFGCFETDPNVETNRKNVLLVLRNKPKINRNRLSFGLFRFLTETFYLFVS